MTNIFKTEINQLINQLLKNFSITFLYKFKDSSNTHIFKILDKKVYDSNGFQEFVANSICDLIDKGVYHGICFVDSQDSLFNMNKSIYYESTII